MIVKSWTRRVAFAACVAAIALGLPASGRAAAITEAKLMADGTVVTLPAKVVTYTSTDFFYVQEANSGASLADAPVGGIRVKRTAHGFAVGARLAVTGTMRTNEKFERYVDCSSATTATGTGTVVPWMMNNKSLGGADQAYNASTGAGQRGVSPSGGVNNVGMLVKTTGLVIYSDPGGAFDYISDGSGVSDGNTAGPLGITLPGVRIVIPSGLTRPKSTQHVTVTGISSLEVIGGVPVRAVLAQAIQRNDPTTVMSDMNMLWVPGGEFLMGNSGTGDDATDGYPREYPQHSAYVPSFWISKCEVTRGQYRSFINTGGYSNSSYWSGEGWAWKLSLGRTQPSYWASTQTWQEYLRPDLSVPTFTQNDNLPVVGVSYYEAEAFCKWAGGRLPTEAEWERAARWDGTPRVYPWGNTAGTNKANDWYDMAYSGYQTAPADHISSGASPYGCVGMAGNVWEWTRDWYVSYPGSGVSFDKTGTARAVRGGGWYGVYGERCASRWCSAPGSTDNDMGFRLAR